LQLFTFWFVICFCFGHFVLKCLCYNYFEWLVTEKLDNEVVHHYLPLVAFILAGCTDKSLILMRTSQSKCIEIVISWNQYERVQPITCLIYAGFF
jgi:hypothetical protein